MITWSYPSRDHQNHVVISITWSSTSRDLQSLSRDHGIMWPSWSRYDPHHVIIMMTWSSSSRYPVLKLVEFWWSRFWSILFKPWECRSLIWNIGLYGSSQLYNVHSFFQHHCRNCGGIFCNPCSDNAMPLPSSAKPVRVCDICYNTLLQRYQSWHLSCEPNIVSRSWFEFLPI
jgi:hypothetical protein